MEIFCLITKNQNLVAATKRNISITVKVYKNYQKKKITFKSLQNNYTLLYKLFRIMYFLLQIFFAN